MRCSVGLNWSAALAAAIRLARQKLRRREHFEHLYVLTWLIGKNIDKLRLVFKR